MRWSIRLASISRTSGSRGSAHSRSVGCRGASISGSARPGPRRRGRVHSSSQSSAASRSPPCAESPELVERGGRSHRSRAGAERSRRGQARGWRPGSSHRLGARHHRLRGGSARRCVAGTASRSCRSRSLRRRGCTVQAAPERHDREHETVQVIVDVVVRGKPGAGVLRLVPRAIGALGRRHEPGDAALYAPASARPAACSASSAQAVCEAVLGPRPIQAGSS